MANGEGNVLRETRDKEINDEVRYGAEMEELVILRGHLAGNPINQERHKSNRMKSTSWWRRYYVW